MKFLVFLFLWFSASAVHAFKVTESELSGWSTENATILSAYTKADKDYSQEWLLFPPQNPKVYRSKARVKFWKASNNSGKKLLFILSGTGADAFSSKSGYLAALANMEGMDAIVLPNTFTTDFQNSFCFDGLLGSPRNDSKGVQRMIQEALRVYRKLRMNPEHVYVAGYSLGGLHAALLAQSPLAKMIEKFIIINPTIDFVHGITMVDKHIGAVTQDNAPDIFNLLGILSDTFEAGTQISIENFESYRNIKKLDREVGSYLLGFIFKGIMKKVVKNYPASEVFNDLNLEEELRYMEQNLGYVNYAYFSLKSLYATRQASSLDPDKEFVDINLINILNTNVDLSKIRYIDNADDILKNTSQLAQLLDHTKIKYTVFSNGGHCGNMWTPSFKQVFREYLEN